MRCVVEPNTDNGYRAAGELLDLDRPADRAGRLQRQDGGRRPVGGGRARAAGAGGPVGGGVRRHRRRAGPRRPMLTTVRQPLEEMGRMAVTLLMRLLDRHTLEALHVSLATELVIRGLDRAGPDRANCYILFHRARRSGGTGCLVPELGNLDIEFDLCFSASTGSLPMFHSVTPLGRSGTPSAVGNRSHSVSRPSLLRARVRPRACGPPGRSPPCPVPPAGWPPSASPSQRHRGPGRRGRARPVGPGRQRDGERLAHHHIGRRRPHRHPRPAAAGRHRVRPGRRHRQPHHHRQRGRHLPAVRGRRRVHHRHHRLPAARRPDQRGHPRRRDAPPVPPRPTASACRSSATRSAPPTCPGRATSRSTTPAATSTTSAPTATTPTCGC